MKVSDDGGRIDGIWNINKREDTRRRKRTIRIDRFISQSRHETFLPSHASNAGKIIIRQWHVARAYFYSTNRTCNTNPTPPIQIRSLPPLPPPLPCSSNNKIIETYREKNVPYIYIYVCTVYVLLQSVWKISNWLPLGEILFPNAREMIDGGSPPPSVSGHIYAVFTARKATVSIVARGRRIRIPGRPVVSRSEMSGYITSGGATMSDSWLPHAVTGVIFAIMYPTPVSPSLSIGRIWLKSLHGQIYRTFLLCPRVTLARVRGDARAMCIDEGNVRGEGKKIKKKEEERKKSKEE